MPVHSFLILVKGELCSDDQVQLGEVEVKFFSFIPEDAQQSSVQRYMEDLRSASADIKGTVVQPFISASAEQMIGRKPYPWCCKITAPVFICVAIGGFRSDGICSPVEHDCSGVLCLHAFSVPIHIKCFCVPHRLAGPVSDIESDLFVNREIPGHLTVIAHPLRMLLTSGNMYGTLQPCFTCQAVVCLNGVRRIHMYIDFLPCKEPVQLAMIFTPAACFYHEIRGFGAVRQLSQYRFILRQIRIAEKEFYEERFLFACQCIMSGEGMPPPVIALFSEMTSQHARITCNIMNIEHFDHTFCLIVPEVQTVC